MAVGVKPWCRSVLSDQQRREGHRVTARIGKEAVESVLDSNGHEREIVLVDCYLLVITIFSFGKESSVERHGSIKLYVF